MGLICRRCSALILIAYRNEETNAPIVKFNVRSSLSSAVTNVLPLSYLSWVPWNERSYQRCRVIQIDWTEPYAIYIWGHLSGVSVERWSLSVTGPSNLSDFVLCAWHKSSVTGHDGAQVIRYRVWNYLRTWVGPFPPSNSAILILSIDYTAFVAL